MSFSFINNYSFKFYKGDHVLWDISCICIISSIRSVFVLTPFPHSFSPFPSRALSPNPSLFLCKMHPWTHVTAKNEETDMKEVTGSFFRFHIAARRQFIAFVEPISFSVLKLQILQACLCFLVLNK